MKIDLALIFESYLSGLETVAFRDIGNCGIVVGFKSRYFVTDERSVAKVLSRLCRPGWEVEESCKIRETKIFRLWKFKQLGGGDGKFAFLVIENKLENKI